MVQEVQKSSTSVSINATQSKLSNIGQPAIQDVGTRTSDYSSKIYQVSGSEIDLEFLNNTCDFQRHSYGSRSKRPNTPSPLRDGALLFIRMPTGTLLLEKHTELR